LLQSFQFHDPHPSALARNRIQKTPSAEHCTGIWHEKQRCPAPGEQSAGHLSCQAQSPARQRRGFDLQGVVCYNA
jgi:hypothetical protein